MPLTLVHLLALTSPVPLPPAASPPLTINYIYTCHCTDMAGHGYTGGSTIPIFIGPNKLRFRGSGVDLAQSVIIAGLPGKITARRFGELDVTLTIPAAFVTTATNRVGSLKYPIGENSFQVRIIPRGIISSITGLSTAVAVGQRRRVVFNGSDIRAAEFGLAAILPFYGTTGTSTATSYTTDLTFDRCGSFVVGAFHLHHLAAPSKEVQNRNAQYRGSATVTARVTGCSAPLTVVEFETNRFNLAAPVTIATGSPLTQNVCRSIQESLNWHAVAGARGYKVVLRLGDGRSRTSWPVTNQWSSASGPEMPVGTTTWNVRAYQSVFTATTEERHLGPWGTQQSFLLNAYQPPPPSGGTRLIGPTRCF